MSTLNWLSRTALSGALAVGLTSAPLGSAVDAAVVAHTAAEAVPTTSVDLSTPEAGITDPIAGVDPLIRDCKAGQVDINTATAESMGTVLNISSKPTLQRIIAGRPWLLPVHLVSVPGVGPSKEAELRSKACATPTQLPPSNTNHPKAGKGDSEVDLQADSVAKIMTLGLSRPIAERVLAARPLPDNLHQVAAPVIPGLSDPKIDEIIAKGAVVTPMPFSFSGKTWKWVSHDDGAAVRDISDNRYALIVPPGRVAGDGAWATVMKLPDYLGGLPKADFHIHGAWTPEVVGQLPRPIGATSQSLIAWHAAEGGDRVSMYPNTWAGGDQARTALSSLSEVTVDVNPLVQTDPANPANGCNQQAYSVFCPNGPSPQWDLRDGSYQQMFSSKGAYLRSLGYTPTSGEVCNDGGPYVVSSGTLGGAARCDHIEVSDPDAAFIIKNTSNFTWFNSGIVLRPIRTGAGSMVINKTEPGTAGFATDTLKNMLVASGYLPPDRTLAIKVKRGGGTAHLDLTGASVTAAYLAMAQATSLGDLLGVIDLSGCSSLGAASSDAIELATDCFLGVIEKTAESRAIKAPAGSQARVLFAGISKKAAALGVALTAWDAVTSALQYATAGSAASEYQYLYPAAGSGATGSPSGDGTYIARTAEGKAYLVDTTKNEAYSIPTAASFNCLAESRLVVDLVETLRSGGRITLNVSGQPVVVERVLTCSSTSTRWNYRPVAAGGNVPNGVIVKMPDWEGNGSWWINSVGAIETIRDGGTYQCLAARAPVIYNFPFDRVQAWRPVGTKPAQCP